MRFVQFSTGEKYNLHEYYLIKALITSRYLLP